MLLLHQTGSVKIGEVVRYTVTYTPAQDRILPSPSTLSLKIRNTSALALRAAFIHGPYTLYAAAYPSTYSPNTKFEYPRREGVPEFEPNLKAGGSFSCQLVVPADVRESAGTSRRDGRGWDTGHGEVQVKSVSWIIEVSSQVIFSTSAAVHYEILLGRDEKSLNLGLLGNTGPAPGMVSDHQQSAGAKEGWHSAQPKGVYSRAIKVRVDDTASLWNTPRMPEWDEVERDTGAEDTTGKGNKDTPVDSVMKGKDDHDDEGHRKKRQKKVHLVVLTHGLHSNLGADMLYLKESIDATAKQAKVDAKARRAKRREELRRKSANDSHEKHEGERNSEGSTQAPAQQREDDVDDSDEEEVIVRGFSGNAVRTERGIKYLGKRLAKYVLNMTYPNQPYRPVTKATASAISHALKQDPKGERSHSHPTHKDSTIMKTPFHEKEVAYKITSISFIAHSLGGLIQTYAVAYIQKHSPEFFDIIKPINFIAMASPFLGLSNENPLYVKFALDFGLVGRTGQDLGLTWRAPTIARSGWGAIVGGIGEGGHKLAGESAPEAKPLLRILPTGPAHTVLKKFRNRTVYSNVVNDGIVPLRTSCLLFLDWQGLGRVEKARRENGLVGTMAGWGWAEITGANSNYSNSPRRSGPWSDGAVSDDDTGTNTPTRQGHGADVPQPPVDATENDDARSLKGLSRSASTEIERSGLASPTAQSASSTSGPFASLFGLFKPSSSQKQSHTPHQKHTPKIYKRSQTLKIGSGSSTSVQSAPSSPSLSKYPSSPSGNGKATSGNDEHADPDVLSAPPKTTFFESAGDLLKPPLPSVEFLINPSSRPRTIFHDRVYHPSDIPPPPMKKRSSPGLMRRLSSSHSEVRTPVLSSPRSPIPGNINHESSELSTRDYDDTRHTNPDHNPYDVIDGSAMKVEEKIARAYHKDLSWRKVLVRLEPDAHNNMIVRRMFANAYGWPVVKHLVDTHFSDDAIASTRDAESSNTERAKPSSSPIGEDGGEVKEGIGEGESNEERDVREHIHKLSDSDRTDSEVREATDSVPALNPKPKPGSLGKALAGNLTLQLPIGNRGGQEKPRPERLDSSVESATWSERDWADSGDDSDSDIEGYKSDTGTKSRPTSGEKKSAGSAWNWTEAIVGKGAGLTSPRGTNMGEIEKFLSGGQGYSHDGVGESKHRDKPGEDRMEEGDKEERRILESDAAAARVLSGEAAGMGVGLGVEALLVSSPEEESPGARDKIGR